jgi:hypothetical protein
VLQSWNQFGKHTKNLANALFASKLDVLQQLNQPTLFVQVGSALERVRCISRPSSQMGHVAREEQLH